MYKYILIAKSTINISSLLKIATMKKTVVKELK